MGSGEQGLEKTARWRGPTAAPEAQEGCGRVEKGKEFQAERTGGQKSGNPGMWHVWDKQVAFGGWT